MASQITGELNSKPCANLNVVVPFDRPPLGGGGVQTIEHGLD
jgi:hypothetical protein